MRKCEHFCDRCKFPVQTEYDLRLVRLYKQRSEDDHVLDINCDQWELCRFCRELLELFIKGYTIDKMVNIHKK